MSKMQIAEDVITSTRLAALNATLGIERDRPAPFAHQAFFWQAFPETELGQDGHPKTGNAGNLIPDLGLPRRMWAGGKITFHADLEPDTRAARHSSLLSSEVKQGRSGAVGLVQLHHEIFQNQELKIEERQDLVYLPEDRKTTHPPQARTDETISETRSFSTTLLFRYSALTFNGHRIHYDRDYAKGIEGYPGLVVHGPLLAQFLMLLAEAYLPSLKQFEFRATAPLFDFETADFCARESSTGLDLWVRGPDRRECMHASAE